jgi:hypothetical protein
MDWLVVLKKIEKMKVSWDDYSQIMAKLNKTLLLLIIIIINIWIMIIHIIPMYPYG